MGDRQGCFNREPFKKSLIVNNGTEVFHDMVGGESTRHQNVKEIPFVMSLDCMHPERVDDPRCEGCRWVTGTDADFRNDEGC